MVLDRCLSNKVIYKLLYYWNLLWELYLWESNKRLLGMVKWFKYVGLYVLF